MTVASGSEMVHDHAGSTALWQSGPTALVGTALFAVLAVLWLSAARKRGWPPPRTAAFLAGIALTAITLWSGLIGHEDGMTGHVLQHLLLMSAAAPLVVAGHPGQLLLGLLPQTVQREVLAIRADPAVRAVTASRWAPAVLLVDYYLSMAVFLLTPLYTWSTQHMWLHVAAHVYFFACGVLFWTALLGPSVPEWAAAPRARVLACLVGIPANAAIGWAVVALGPSASSTTGWVLAAGGAVLSLAGAAVVAGRRPALAASPTAHPHEEFSWPAAS